MLPWAMILSPHHRRSTRSGTFRSRSNPFGACPEPLPDLIGESLFLLSFSGLATRHSPLATVFRCCPLCPNRNASISFFFMPLRTLSFTTRGVYPLHPCFEVLSCRNLHLTLSPLKTCRSALRCLPRPTAKGATAKGARRAVCIPNGFAGRRAPSVASSAPV
jgi:hypothetical protein